jgi:glycosyltransferase involved in cell wall biosynthesis
MSSHPQVSVIVATYNYGRFLAGALDSVLDQTFADYEIIVVDDGSNDGTGDVIAPYLRHSKLRYIRTDHLGQPKAKNTGIRAARGKYVAFLDADDLWLPTKLDKQVAVFREDPELGVVYSRWQAIDEHGRSIPDWARPVHRGHILPQVFRQSFICFSSSVVRLAVLSEVGLFDERIPLAIDYDLWLRIAQRYRFDYVDEQLVKYRTGHANLSRRAQERAECVQQIMRRFLDERGGRSHVDPALVREAWAEQYCDTAWSLRGRSALRRLYWYGRAAVIDPRYLPAWRGLLVSWWPEPLRDRMRRVFARE